MLKLNFKWREKFKKGMFQIFAMYVDEILIRADKRSGR